MTTLASLLLLLGPLAAADDPKNTSGVEIPPLPTFETEAPEKYGWQLADYAQRYDTGWVDEIWQGRMELFDAQGDSVQRQTLRMLLEDPEGDKSIVRFVSPAEIKGVAALTHEHPGSSDDNWLYLPSTKRVRRISGANKTASFQGTEFTYEDLSTLALADYDWRFVEESTLQRGDAEVPVYIVEARPNYRDTGYSRLLIAYNREHFGQERIQYFDKAGVHLKTLETGSWKQLHGRFWRAFELDMQNHQTGKHTKLEFRQVFLNLSLYTSKRTGKPRANLTAEAFTTRALSGN
jgi:hypothetical protein